MNDLQPYAEPKADMMDSILNEVVASVGLPSLPKRNLDETYERIREIDDNDLALLMDEVPYIDSVQLNLKELSTRHHRAARLIAGGVSLALVAQTLGTSLDAMTRLQGDPAFQNLIATYKEEVVDEQTVVQAKLHDVTSAALTVLGTRLEESPDGFTNAQLTDLVKNVGAQAGFAPVTKQLNMNLNGVMSATDLQAMKQEALKNNVGKVITIEKSSVHALTQESESGSDSWIDSTAEEVQRPDEGQEGLSRQGEDV